MTSKAPSGEKKSPYIFAGMYIIMLTTIIMVGLFSIDWKESNRITPSRKQDEQTANKGHVFNNIVDNGNVIGFSLREYEQGLEKRKRDINHEYKKLVQNLSQHKRRSKSVGRLEQKKQAMNIELRKIKTHLRDINHYYKMAVADKQARIDDLRKFKEHVPKSTLKAAQIALARGNDDKAITLCKQVIDQSKKANILVAKARHFLGQLAYDRIDYQETADQYRLAIKYAKMAQNGDAIAYYQSVFGQILDVLARYDEAIAQYELALDYYDRRKQSQDVANVLNALGVVYNHKGEYDKALDYYEKCLALNIRVLGEQHPVVTYTWNNLGAMYDDKGEYDRAIDYFEKSLAVRLKVLGEQHPDTLRAQRNLEKAKRKYRW